MGLYLLNISVDTADRNPQHIPENLSINDQESIIEIVVEEFLGYENAIKEYDDNDTEDHNQNTNIKIDLITQYAIDYNTSQLFFVPKTQKNTHYNTFLAPGFYQLETPPPKV